MSRGRLFQATHTAALALGLGMLDVAFNLCLSALARGMYR